MAEAAFLRPAHAGAEQICAGDAFALVEAVRAVAVTGRAGAADTAVGIRAAAGPLGEAAVGLDAQRIGLAGGRDGLNDAAVAVFLLRAADGGGAFVRGLQVVRMLQVAAVVRAAAAAQWRVRITGSGSLPADADQRFLTSEPAVDAFRFQRLRRSSSHGSPPSTRSARDTATRGAAR